MDEGVDRAAGEPARTLSDAELRDVLIRAHGMATGNFVQSAEVMRQRIGRLLEKAIEQDDVMRGVLGRGGPCADRDILGGGRNRGRLETDARAAVEREEAASGLARRRAVPVASETDQTGA